MVLDNSTSQGGAVASGNAGTSATTNAEGGTATKASIYSYEYRKNGTATNGQNNSSVQIKVSCHRLVKIKLKVQHLDL